MTHTSPIRVLLVDDHDLVRAGFRTIMSVHPRIEVVGEAANGIEAVEKARSLAPDVICLDVQMPHMDGIEATRLITTDPGINSAVLILTTFNREDYLFDALRAGASGFLLKNSSPEQLVDAVVAIASGDALLSPQVTRSVIAHCARASGSPSRGTPTATGTPIINTPSPPMVAPSNPLSLLTDREHEVLHLLAQGLSNQEIATRLFVSEATVKTHVSNVLRKLSLRDRIQAVIFAYENGVAVGT
ncbi:response regulator transcription factor [Klugiella xanthotipulae]|uniref:LuxR family two component transcriptional regulator n=1 Tax=Klugiella xanthotipulae TaxID=244735 RepID=A0A543I6F3_9MICO|nr:response regulator transcription factor [Klugiella xanthotipulae]TQM66158.1 LuxR family two component transcriptional regulator [Klugiella xanthotipulae]